MPISLIERAVADLPHASFGQSYGMTEASPVLTILAPEHHDPSGPHPDRLKSVGQPVVYSDLRIFDERDNPLLPGETGEIVIRGPQIMNGYWNQPERTAHAMRGGYYHTGDAGYLDEDGFLFLAGRVKEMIITGGENVYPIETENALSKHPLVAECAVIGIPHEKWGEAVHAVVRLKPGEMAGERDLIDHCRALIAHYKCPLEITFRDEPMPLSPTNKISKTALRDEVLAAAS
jgi:acyl-CoA synthetase (AMP-forming)/AMP-acid ligase II